MLSKCLPNALQIFPMGLYLLIFTREYTESHGSVHLKMPSKCLPNSFQILYKYIKHAIKDLPDLVPDFKNFIIDDKSPKAVIIGDIYKEFNWITLNHVFQLINNNECLLIALHKNKYCKREDTISLDLGPFVSALEYASNKKAIVIGKPEKDFFDLAINSLNLNKDEILMIGDDIISDIKGSKDNLIKAIQVKTGKYQKHDENSNFIQPDIRIKSINDLPNVINN